MLIVRNSYIMYHVYADLVHIKKIKGKKISCMRVDCDESVEL